MQKRRTRRARTARLLRDLAVVLRSVGVQPRDPLVHDLAMALDVISQLVRAAECKDPEYSGAP